MKNKKNIYIVVILLSLASFLFTSPCSFAGIRKEFKKKQHFPLKKVSYQSMNELLNLLYTIIKDKRSHWSNAQTVNSVLACLIEECGELKEALKLEDYEKAKEEMGDILGMTLQLGLIAERDGVFGINEAAADQIEKTRRRAPYVFDAKLEKEISNLTQAIELWYAIKRKEREKIVQ